MANASNLQYVAGKYKLSANRLYIVLIQFRNQAAAPVHRQQYLLNLFIKLKPFKLLSLILCASND